MDTSTAPIHTTGPQIDLHDPLPATDECSLRELIPLNSTVPTPVNPLYFTVELICCAGAVLENALVLLLFSNDPRLRSTTNCYIISLASADFLVGLVAIPSAILTSVGLPKNFHGCLFMNSLLLLLCTASILSLVAVTVDRYWAILHPFSYRNRMARRWVVIVILACWVLSAVIGMLPLMGWNLGPPAEPRCFFMEVIDLRYLVLLFVLTIILPSLFMAIVYVKIFVEVRRQIRKTEMLRVPSTSETHPRWRSECRTVASLSVIVTAFVISWIPLYLINTLLHFRPTTCIPMWVINLSIALSHMNSVWNPIVYALGMKDFKLAFKRLTARKSRRVSNLDES